ncbi:MAG: EpsI family protein [Bryobacterales bacterium]|nr:EpsI family protein [Bryobacterales bacterium]
MSFLGSPHSRVLSALLVLHIAAAYGFRRSENPPAHTPLKMVPAAIGGWRLAQEGVIEKEVRDVLQADDLLNRTYVHAESQSMASLFVAYFRSQRTGVAPHSPKNCLPGSGWVPSEARIIPIAVPGRAEPIPVNLYLVSKGDSRSVTLYWYQSRGRAVASEYSAKIYTVLDAIRFNRTDTALVRVVVPVTGGGQDAARRVGERFVGEIFPTLAPFLPN